MVNTEYRAGITAETPKNLDVVLLSLSGSMNDNAKWKPQVAARNFANTLLPESGLSNTRIALVPYASGVGKN